MLVSVLDSRLLVRWVDVEWFGCGLAVIVVLVVPGFKGIGTRYLCMWL